MKQPTPNKLRTEIDSITVDLLKAINSKYPLDLMHVETVFKEFIDKGHSNIVFSFIYNELYGKIPAVKFIQLYNEIEEYYADYVIV